MSLHDLMTADLAHITGDTGHGFATRARLAGRHDVPGLLDREYTDVLGVESRGPVFTCAESSLPNASAANVRHGDALVVYLATGAISYTVRGVQPDGHGEVRLILEEGD